MDKDNDTPESPPKEAVECSVDDMPTWLTPTTALVWIIARNPSMVIDADHLNRDVEKAAAIQAAEKWPTAPMRWTDANAALIRALGAGRLVARGRRRGQYGERRDIPPDCFARGGTALYSGRDPLAGHEDVVMATADVLMLWPLAGKEAANQQLEPTMPVYHTGLPGRPNSKNLIKSEYRRRVSDGGTWLSLHKAAEDLCDWLSQSHPSAPLCTVKTIENNLREEYRKSIKPQ